MTDCDAVGGDQYFGQTCCLHVQCRKGQWGPPKCWYPFTRLHVLKSKSTLPQYPQNLLVKSSPWQNTPLCILFSPHSASLSHGQTQSFIAKEKVKS